MSQRELKLETRFSDRNNRVWIALGAAVVLLGLIAASIWTTLPEYLLPMNEETMSALIPLGADGGEPLSLREISHEVTGHTLRVYGAVENRCPTEIQNLTVVIAPFGINKKAEDVLEALVEPAVVPGRERATFDVTTETVFLPGEYRVRFKIKDGPFLPHKDERSGAQPPPDEPAKAGK